MKLSRICGFIAVLAASPAWGQALEPTELEIAIDAAAVTESRVQVTPTQSKQLEEIALSLTKGQDEKADMLWEEFVSDVALSGEPIDIDALVQWVLRSAYLESTSDLEHYAEKVRYYNELKSAMRAEIQRLRNFKIALEKAGADSKATLVIADDLEAILSEAEVEAQLADIDLQNILQKQQQTLQALANISKILHDTATAIIRKTGG